MTELWFVLRSRTFQTKLVKSGFRGNVTPGKMVKIAFWSFLRSEWLHEALQIFILFSTFIPLRKILSWIVPQYATTSTIGKSHALTSSGLEFYVKNKKRTSYRILSASNFGSLRVTLTGSQIYSKVLNVHILIPQLYQDSMIRRFSMWLESCSWFGMTPFL